MYEREAARSLYMCGLLLVPVGRAVGLLRRTRLPEKGTEATANPDHTTLPCNIAIGFQQAFFSAHRDAQSIRARQYTYSVSAYWADRPFAVIMCVLRACLSSSLELSSMPGGVQLERGISCFASVRVVG